MWRALGKGLGLATLGHLPGGSAHYRRLTRDLAGSQATHVDKLVRILPGYLRLWMERTGLRLPGARLWMHEGGWTPYPFLAAYLLTGSGGVVTNGTGRMLDRYLVRAVNGALATQFGEVLVSAERRRRVEALRWTKGIAGLVSATGGTLCEHVDPCRLPPKLASSSIDLLYSGGALEHLAPPLLRRFLAESCRVLVPGGIASHVFDHRDHLHHADKGWPFLAHLALPDAVYDATSGHPLGYHNRLTPAAVTALFREAGFEVITIRRLILPEHIWVEGDEALRGIPGLSRRWLAERFRQISEIDLRTAAAHYLCQRPPSQ